MKVLLLISGPGKGHARCAEAIDAALRGRDPGIETDSVNIYGLIDPRVSAAMTDGYLRMVAEQPALYQRLYDLDKRLYQQLAGELPPDREVVEFMAEQQRRSFPEMAGRPWFAAPYRSLDTALVNTLINGVRESRRFLRRPILLKGVLKLIHRILADRLMEAVQIRKPDILVATQVYPPVLLSRAIESGMLQQPLIGVLTDYGAHGLWVRSTTRHYCVGHEHTAQMLADKQVRREHIHVTGIPLMPAFDHIPSQSDARRRLGLDDRPTVLITGGEYAIGTLDAVQHITSRTSGTIRMLVTSDAQAVGDHTLDSLAEMNPRLLKVYPWTDEMAVLMRAADVVVGKPGGLTVSESLACGRPFIASCSLGGQEAHNVRFLERYGIGCRLEPEQLPGRLRELFENPSELVAWQTRAAEQAPHRSAMAVADLIERCVRHADLRQLTGSRALLRE